jgi:hypothetical protein
MRTLSLIAVLLLPLFAAPPLVLSNQEVRILGVIMSIDNRQETFLIQELNSAAQGRTWSVRVTSGTVGRRPEDRVGTGAAATLRLLRVGDIAEVEGVMFAGNQLLARQVTVRSEAGGNGRDRDLGRDIRLRGTITDLQTSAQGVFRLQESSRVRGFPWTVQLHPQIKVEGQLDDRGQEKVDGRGPQIAMRLLRVGDVVDVQGRVIGSQQIQAREIRFRGQTGAFPVPVPGPVPFPGQTVIITPHEGEEIRTEEFSVIGQTAPGAQVRIGVGARFGVFQVQVASGTVTADTTGYFVFVVRPSVRIPGSVYTITATSIFQGQTAPAVSVTVRQL